MCSTARQQLGQLGQPIPRCAAARRAGACHACDRCMQHASHSNCAVLRCAGRDRSQKQRSVMAVGPAEAEALRSVVGHLREL